MSGFDKTTLNFDIGRSLRLCLLNLAVHGAALAGIWWTAFPVQLQMVLSAVVVITLVVTLRRYVLLAGPLSVTGVRLAGECWQLELQSGEVRLARLRGQVLITSFLLVMNFVDEDGRGFAVPLFLDSVSAEQHRQGRVYFRMAAYDID